MGLSDVLIEQGRYEEAEKLARVALDINREIGVPDETQHAVQLLSILGGLLNLQGKNGDAYTVYTELDKAIAQWDLQRRQVFELNDTRIYSLYASGQIERGLTAAQALLKREMSNVGETHFRTAVARGTVAIGYMRAGKESDAIREFKAAVPILVSDAHENVDTEDTTLVAAREARLQDIAEAYIGLLAVTVLPRSAETAIETFQLADAIRGHSVQQALSASSARMVAKDPALAELIRTEQDLGKQINAQHGMLNNALSLPSSERDDAAIHAINVTIERARSERIKARAEIARRFPSYADLIDPKAPTAEQIRSALHPGEALVSFYFGRGKSFVWVVPKQG